MKPTLKADVLSRARGSFLGAPVSVTRDEDDPKRTRRLSPAEMNALVEGEQRYRFDAVGIIVGIVLAFVGGICVGYAPRPVPKLPPPVRLAPTVMTLVAIDLPPPAPERVLQRLTRSKAKLDIKKPLFQEKP